MPYVERDQTGNLKGVYARLQAGYAEELLADDNAEVVAFRNPPPGPEELRRRDFISDADRADMLSKIKDATPQQIKTYVTANVTNLAEARVMLMKILLMLATAIRE